MLLELSICVNLVSIVSLNRRFAKDPIRRPPLHFSDASYRALETGYLASPWHYHLINIYYPHILLEYINLVSNCFAPADHAPQSAIPMLTGMGLRRFSL